MSRKFIAAVLAVSTTLATFGAAPARAASEEDIAKFLGAAATIFIIGKAIENSRDKKDDKKKKTITHKSKPVVQTYQQQRHSQTYTQKHVPQVVTRTVKPQRAALPQRCVQRISGGQVRRVVMAPCLARHYRSARALPRACEMTVATQRGHRRAYALPCLRQRGYQVARH